VPFTEIHRIARVPVGESAWRFPPASAASAEGLLAIGADFAPATLLQAYRCGIFPWPHGDLDRLWWSPSERGVLVPSRVHISRRLARTIRQERFRATINTAFEAVIDACTVREEGTWITPNLRDAFLHLHQLGWAHSVEVRTADGALAGGLYGLALGGLFAAESMFHRERDASKVAVVALAQHGQAAGIELVDAQMLTPHLASLGFMEITRDDYLRRIADLAQRETRFP
jgi:leucyl/phenylalanyl-tRNA--protein transferase